MASRYVRSPLSPLFPRQPVARYFHAAVSFHSNLLVWGGYCGTVGLDDSAVEHYDVLSMTWGEERQELRYLCLRGLRRMAIACDGEIAYTFGGRTAQFGLLIAQFGLINDIYEVDLRSLACNVIQPSADSGLAPSARSNSAIVISRRRLIGYGGYTLGGVASNELHVFNLDKKTWTAQDTTGEKPPALYGHSLTLIEQFRAVMFGGFGRGHYHNDTYLLDTQTWKWSKMKTSKKPPARHYHSACVIDSDIPGHYPLLMVVGGWGDGETLLSDVWFLDVTSRSWHEVHASLPTARFGHSAVVFGTGPDFRVVVLFGGRTIVYRWSETSETTLLLLSRKGRSWVVERVVCPATLTEQERDKLVKQFSKLQISSSLSDERAQKIIDEALESSSVKIRNVVAVLTGLMGSGKTWFLSRLFNQLPPSFYASTGIAEQSFRSLLHHLGNMSAQSWELFSHRHVLEFLASVFREQQPPADIVRLAERIASIEDSDDSDALPLPLASSDPEAEASADENKVPRLLRFIHGLFTKSEPTTTPTVTASPEPPTPAPKSSTTQSNTSQSMVRLVKAPKISGSVPMLELLHMIDTGGQPEFMENMPSYVHNCHLAVLVLNLMFGLDDYPPIHYHDKEGKAYNRALPSQHTNRQIIQKVASTLQANRFSRKAGQCFRLLAIATHRDCVAEGELPARIKAFHEALKAILLPACDNELIPYSENEIPFVLNLKNPNDNDLAKLALIREKISESGVGEEVEMPGSFLIFEQELLEFSKQEVKRDIVSLAECMQVGEKLKMKPEVVEAGLIFFHRQITLLYFRHVLPNVVFTKPQLPLDVINSIVNFSYKVASGELKGIKPNVAKSLRDGIVTEEILSHDLILKCFIPNLYEAQHAIQLMCHNFTLAPLSREPQSKTGSGPAVQPNPSTPIEGDKREYLMMSLCPAIPDKDIPQYIPAPSDIVPLVVKFSKDCVPLSCFSSTISCLLSIYDWRLTRADDGSPQCLAHNVVSLYDPQLPVQIVILDATNSLQIHIHPEEDSNSSIFPRVCFYIREAIFSAIPEVFDTLQLTGIEISPAFLCSCSQSSEPHSASPYKSLDSKWHLRCSKTERSVGAALEKHTMWLDTPVTEVDKPSLPKLLTFKVPEKVGARFEGFGCLLLNDDDGCIMEVIEHDCQGQCKRIVQKTLSEWLRGKGKPVTWKVLTDTLRECELTTLADVIQENTQISLLNFN